MSSFLSMETLEVKIDNTQKDLDTFKQDIKEEIKEIKQSVKDSEQLFSESIMVMKENNASMKENITWLTTIAGQQREELKLIRESQMNQPQEDANVKWYQDNFNRLILFLFALILLLLGLDMSGIELLK